MRKGRKLRIVDLVWNLSDPGELVGPVLVRRRPGMPRINLNRMGELYGDIILFLGFEQREYFVKCAPSRS